MANVRTFYACQAVQLGAVSGSDAVNPTQAWTTLDAVQSVGITTNFNLDPVYQLGDVQPGDLFEDIPDVEISLTKQILSDGASIYKSMMGEGDLTDLADNRSAVRLLIYPDTVTKATGVPTTNCVIQPAYLSSITWNFPSDGPFTEEATIVGNNKVWDGTVLGVTDASPTENLTGVARRQMYNEVSSIVPTGINTTNYAAASGGIPASAKFQSISVSVDLGREEIFQLGERLPFTRYINFPVEVTTDFEVIHPNGDQVGASETEASCSNPKALTDKRIVLTLCDGTSLDLGTKNKLNSVSTAGGDAGGDNVVYTYSYVNYSKLDYTHGASVSSVGGMEQVDLQNYSDSFSAYGKKE